MTKLIKSLVILGSLALCLNLAVAAMGGMDGAGGGGIRRDGQVLTFGNAGVQVGVKPLSADQIPGLSDLMDGLGRLDLPVARVSQVKRAAYPLGKRAYFAIQDISDSKRQELLQVYSKLVGSQADPKELTIFALTRESETYLLPDFFALKNSKSQAAVLFHELSWVMNASQSYDDVVRAEIAFEKYLNTPKSVKFDREVVFHLAGLLSDPMMALTAAYREDVRQKRIQDLDPQNRATTREIFGPEASEILEKSSLDAVMVLSKESRLHQAMNNYWFQKFEAEPNGEFYRALMVIVQNKDCSFRGRQGDNLFPNVYSTLRIDASTSLITDMRVGGFFPGEGQKETWSVWLLTGKSDEGNVMLAFGCDLK